MESDVERSLSVLAAELKRLEGLRSQLAGAADAALQSAHDGVARAIGALKEAAGLAAAASLPAERASAAARIVTIEPRAGAETFRTKVKLKVAEPVAAPPVDVTEPMTAGCDLTRIRGIDRALAVRLAAQGITSFADIAAWSHLDVRRISEALGLGRQINQQNWIEQAALLRGPATAGKPVSTVKPEGHPAAAMAPPTPDRLDLIRGVDATIAEALHSSGTTRWAEIAAWRRVDIARVSAVLASTKAIPRQGWIEQAALLATGRLSHYARRMLAGDFSAVVAAPTAEPLPDPYFTPWQTPPATPIATIADQSSPPQAIVPAPMRSPFAEERPTFALSQAVVPPVENFAEATALDVGLEVSSKPDSAANAETTIAAALERVAALEQELAAQIANDAAAAPRTARTPASSHQPPASNHDSEDLEPPEIDVGEADVIIVRKGPKPAAVRRVPGAAARDPIARLKRSPPLDDIDSATYAAYRDQVEEASVEIVTPGVAARPLATVPAEPPPEPEHRVIRRLLRPFTGKP